MHTFAIQDQTLINEQIVKDILLDNDQVKIQFSKQVYTFDTLKQIDKLTSEYDDRLLIRFYNDGFDCAALEHIPNVKALSIDCINDVKNISKLKNLRFLTKIGLGVFHIEDLDVLSFDSFKKVKRLSILDTKSKVLNLEHLKDYYNLTYLKIGGHTKNIDALANLSQLKTLFLNGVSKVPLSFVNNLKALETLYVILGGRSDINEITETNVENLTIDWVKGFNDLSAIKNFKYLKSLTVEQEIQLKEIEFPALTFLEHIKIWDSKCLKFISGLEKLTSLKELRVSGVEICFEDFVALNFPKNLKRLEFYTRKSKQDKLNREILDKMGYSGMRFTP